MPVMLDFFPVSDRLVELRLLVLLPGRTECRRAGALRIHREHRQHALEVRALALLAGWNVLTADQRLEGVST